MAERKLIVICLLLCSSCAFAQQDTTAPVKDSMSKFDRFNQKAEGLFKILPVPIFSYSTEQGNTFGLAKFNLFDLSKKDTISKPSKLSGIVTFSSKGRINASLSTELVYNENKNIVLSYVNYRKQPEYIFGIGNDVVKEDVEEVEYDRFKFFTTALWRVKENLYVGVPLDIASYFNVEPDSASFLIKNNVAGLNGGFSLGTGLALAYDSRDNRYNTYKGGYAIGTLIFHPEFLGSVYEFTRFELDVRKFFNPWLKHVIALQATTTSATGNTPFYELAQMGGDKQMRGYYLGAYRDKVLVDGQVEYRMPIWNIFGMTAWVGTGRVANSYNSLSLDGFKLSYGLGLRIRVDSKHNTNLRVDFGFGQNGIKGTYISFAEAF
jgi:hypothetical protein